MLGLAIDQKVLNNYPVTQYYFWPRTEAWELKIRTGFKALVNRKRKSKYFKFID